MLAVTNIETVGRGLEKTAGLAFHSGYSIMFLVDRAIAVFSGRAIAF